VARTALATGGEVTLDLTHLDADWVHRRFPTVSAVCARVGLDLARDQIPVTPAAHYAIGGVLADLSGRSTQVGLYVIGECAATGLHGANRLASNSLLEAAVMAVQCADDLGAGGRNWSACDPVALPPPTTAPATPSDTRSLRELMWAAMGLERDENSMRDALTTLEGRTATSAPDERQALTLARLSLMAARHRAESRGAHYRRDLPTSRPEWAHRVAWLGGQPYALAAGHRPIHDTPHAKETA
jgi:L-aspartate oxidase